MAFPVLARRLLRREHLKFFFSTLFLHSQPSLHETLCQTFRRTLGAPFRNSLISALRFSTLEQHNHHRQDLYDSLQFKPENNNQQFDSELRQKFLGAIEKVSGLSSEDEAISALESSGLKVTSEVVYWAIWALKEDAKLALLAFKWGQRLGCCSDEQAWNLIVSVLGDHGKFNTAWCLIRDLNNSLLSTRRAMIIMIDRYAKANDPGKAIWTFEVMEKFNMKPDREAFYASLKALCNHGYIDEAEELMLKNKKIFRLKTEGFNIILHAWCNISVDFSAAKRIWREIPKRCLFPNETSYTHLISCASKVGNLFESFRLYDEMKRRNFVPGFEVYNSLVSVLARQNCHKEALKMVEKMKESGFNPDSTTFNAMITSLCKAGKSDVAREVLETMTVENNLEATLETYHAFLESSGFEQTLEILVRMKNSGSGPVGETFCAILEKLFLSKQPENAMTMFELMGSYEIAPDSSHYIIMIRGLESCGLFIDAREILVEMKSRGFVVDPKLDILLKVPEANGSGPKERNSLGLKERSQPGPKERSDSGQKERNFLGLKERSGPRSKERRDSGPKEKRMRPRKGHRKG